MVISFEGDILIGIDGGVLIRNFTVKDGNANDLQRLAEDRVLLAASRIQAMRAEGIAAVRAPLPPSHLH